RHRSARATVRVRGADAAKSKFDRDVRMRRAAENLQRERGIHSARSFFQKSNVLIFRLANSAERGAETHADSMLRIFASILNARIIERHLRRRDGELRVTIEPLQTMRRKKFFRIPIRNLAAAMRVEDRRIETGDALDAASFRAQPAPEIFHAFADAGDRTDAGDDGATFHFDST